MSIAERVTDHVHPLLAALKADPSGESAFWERMAAEKTPLVEPDPARPGHSLVTYVFRLPETPEHVVITPGFGLPTDNVMDASPGTRICHATYRYRNDVRATYSFTADMPLCRLRAGHGRGSGRRCWSMLMAAAPSPDPHARETLRQPRRRGPARTTSRPSQPAGRARPAVPERRPDVPHGKVDRAHASTSDGDGQRAADLGLHPAGLRRRRGAAIRCWSPSTAARR